MNITPKDNRDKLWAELELGIKRRNLKKDKKFKLAGKWKKYLHLQNGYKVFAVDGNWIRNNLCAYFGHGGHACVHEFIPQDEIWISTHHYYEGNLSIDQCGCKTKTKNQPTSKNYFLSTTLHEITEYDEMKKGKPYWVAHNIALDKERESGLLNDPFEDL